MIKSICRITAAAVMTLSMTSVMYAKHESNNFATLSSSIPRVSGQAVVNYVKGTEGWVSQVRVLGLPDGIYLFAVRLNAGVLQPICNFEVEGAGSGGCSDQDAVLSGFNQAVIIDLDGNVVVASGTFERRGTNREK
ncbi:MAG: hypothetical protein H0U19_13390 [Acidobacteria bacterium]|nr:hypothetical protein [Acidobacteriota bacterium]